jgi:membrane associated rhomboid family serine protease
VRPLTVTGVRQTIRSAPATFCYLFILAATTGVLSVSSTRTDGRLLFELSTNLHQLARVPVRVLVASAFWIGGWSQFALTACLFAAVVVPVERRLGWRRTTVAFAAGHVGATLLVAASLWIALDLDAINATVADARDVGASYGFFAVAGLATYLLSPLQRVPYLAALAGYVIFAAAVWRSFADFGHMTALAIGLACYALSRRDRGELVTSTESCSSREAVRSTPVTPTSEPDCLSDVPAPRRALRCRAARSRTLARS